MINLLNLEEITKDLEPVTSPEFTIGKGAALHPEGLFSEVIFGPKDTVERRKTFSFIELNCKVLHPALFVVIRRLERKLIDAMNKEKSFRLTDEGTLVADPEGNINGITSIIENFENIKFRSEESKTRDDLIRTLQRYIEMDQVFISKSLVIPAFFRDIDIDQERGRVRIDPINDHYVKIIRLSLQLQSIQSGEIFDVLTSKMNQLVLELYKFITTKIGKKQGLIRGNILGKRADFTARAVITGASDEIKVDEIGVPFRLLVKIFEPFIIFDLMRSGNVTQSSLGGALREYNSSTLSVVTLRGLLAGIFKGDELPEELETIIKASVQRVVKDKVVLAKRDPAINSESVQAFKPIMIDGSTIKLNILKCGGFNADFDGDSFLSCIKIKYNKGKKMEVYKGFVGNLEELEV